MAPLDGMFPAVCHQSTVGLADVPDHASLEVARHISNCHQHLSIKRQRVALQDVSHVVNLHPLLSQQQIAPSAQASAAVDSAVAAERPPKRKSEGSDIPSVPSDDNSEPECSASAPAQDDSYLSVLRERELHHRCTAPRVQQHEVTNAMRLILVDWLVEVGQEFRLGTDTLHLAVNILDRYLHIQPVAKPNFQLLGIASLWIAAKFEEVHPPTVRDCVDFTDNCYNTTHLTQMEQHILSTLNFDIAVPTISHFIRELLDVNTHIYTPTVSYLAHYLAELLLLHGALPSHLPSELATACICVALQCTGPTSPIPASFLAAAGYTADHLRPCIQTVAGLHRWAATTCKPPAVKVKYSDPRLLSVASIPFAAPPLTPPSRPSPAPRPPSAPCPPRPTPPSAPRSTSAPRPTPTSAPIHRPSSLPASMLHPVAVCPVVSMAC